MAVESETEPKGERRVEAKVSKGETLGKRPAEDPGEPTQRQSEATSGEKTWVERDKRQPAGSPPDLDHSRCPHASE